ncbi:hypothetical protein [Nonomuraea insulae]|uniref:Uncharacterized protein n=1 Tax=Nonomuraea insulae TaxID=1616787 RepID=A0ABW1CZL0_9ACTN
MVTLTVVMAVVPVATAWLTKPAMDGIAAGAATIDAILILGLALLLYGSAHGRGPAGIGVRQRVGITAQGLLFAATERFVGLARFEEPEFRDRLRMAQQSGGGTPGMIVGACLGIGSAIIPDPPSRGRGARAGRADGDPAVARAYQRGERDVMILDEPSPGLDPEAEHQIHLGLRRFRQGRTSLLVSHRPSAIRSADQIVGAGRGPGGGDRRS